MGAGQGAGPTSGYAVGGAACGQTEPKVNVAPGPTRATTLPSDAAGRKAHPVASGVMDYFPDALVAIANVSYRGNEQHNPGQPLHWARGKSTDEADTLQRHFLQRGSFDTDGIRHSAKMAWRALALLQKEIEQERKALVQAPTLDPRGMDCGKIPPFRRECPQTGGPCFGCSDRDADRCTEQAKMMGDKRDTAGPLPGANAAPRICPQNGTVCPCSDESYFFCEELAKRMKERRDQDKQTKQREAQAGQQSDNDYAGRNILSQRVVVASGVSTQSLRDAGIDAGFTIGDYVNGGSWKLVVERERW